MRLCSVQSANIRVTRRRSDLVSSPQSLPRGSEVLTSVVPYQLRFWKCPKTHLGSSQHPPTWLTGARCSQFRLITILSNP